MLTGLGNQAWMKESYEDDRRKALDDRTKYSDEELEILDLDDNISLGGGKTNPKSYVINQYPYPQDTAIRPKLQMDLRLRNPKVGGA